jgi:hypothetical protein
MEREEIDVEDPAVFLPHIQGRTVTGYEVHTDGLHLYLNDGSILVFVGILCLMKNTSAH